jgi:predicted helicase
MSQQLISRYLNDLSDLRRVSGEVRESVVREAFKTLLKDWGRSKKLIFVPEYRLDTATKDRRFVDGALLHELRVPFGFWEAKDEEDDLDNEIEKKFRRGYPQDNIVFEDSREAVLIQDRGEVMRCPVDDPERLEKLLGLFFSHERPEIADFRKAVAQFKADLPAVLEALRAMIERAEAENPAFHAAAVRFLTHAQETINPSVTAADVREMLIQHILTEEIFSHVFDNADFHRQNNVARELYRLEETFFTGAVKHQTLEGLRSYYAAIRSAAALVSSHHEKQTFLKVVYENFYKVYNRKAADRLGVIYTPSEIVRFMIESADWLCQRHFGKQLIDRNVEILDPAVGTGTFIAELIEHFRGQPAKLKHKYREELHANEVAILPYYVANLNIEATYAALTGEYEEYPNLCFVDTLDNVGGLRVRGRQGDLLGALSEENVARIKRQNSRKISVIIGNPPYNANQLNENENNKNRTYPAIDQRIKETYIAASTAQKTKLYDPYARFFRWASDRIEENGIVAFISNRGFLDKRTYDGFRGIIEKEFRFIHVLDLGGDVRDDPRLSGTTHNVFGIQTGVAISFLVKRSGGEGCRIFYARRPQRETREEKLSFLQNTRIDSVQFEEVRPTDRHDWINLPQTDFSELMPLISKSAKYAKSRSQEQAVCKLYSLGLSTNRDEWVIDLSRQALAKKMAYFCETYEQYSERGFPEESDIKLSRNLKRRAARHQSELYSPARIKRYEYRPFIVSHIYDSEIFIDERGSADLMLVPEDNPYICFIGDATEKPFSVFACRGLVDLNFLSAAAAGTKLIPLYRGRTDNITDWALDQFRAHYADGTPAKRPITKDAVFHYVYGVLHDPIYREKYALNLRREFPRIPFYADFWGWAEWGERLMALHIGYETVEPWPLRRINLPDQQARNAGLAPRALLRADKSAGAILLDTETQLSGIPASAWDYRLGNRSALEWVLDQHKEKTPRDPTIREKFNTYRFADYKDKVIDLLGRVTRVSVETMAIVAAMRQASGSA